MQGPSAANSPAPAGTNAAGTPAGTNTTGASGNVGTQSKPVVATTGFASVSSTTAVVVGTVNPQGSQTTYWFEYGPTLSLGSRVDTTMASASFQEVGASGYLTNLKPNTTYYFRLGATNAYGTVYGSPYNFITLAK